ncbi:MAG: helix-turn-helix transcriptional regulator [Actinobacteria bacterium]|nr:helix-turn-helix transcriptional regulator [Actinomycetota bacterium]
MAGQTYEATFVEDYDAPVYVISIAAELADMHPQTLRAYERKGLIDPSRTEGNTRRYSRRDVDKLKFIQRLTQEEGLNIAGVRAVLEMGQKLDNARKRIGELEDMVRHLASRLETDVEAAHKSHRFEIIPAPGRQMEVHERLRRRPPKQNAS